MPRTRPSAKDPSGWDADIAPETGRLDLTHEKNGMLSVELCAALAWPAIGHPAPPSQGLGSAPYSATPLSPQDLATLARGDMPTAIPEGARCACALSRRHGSRRSRKHCQCRRRHRTVKASRALGTTGSSRSQPTRRNRLEGSRTPRSAHCERRHRGTTDRGRSAQSGAGARNDPRKVV